MNPALLLGAAILGSGTAGAGSEPLRMLALGDSYTIGEGVAGEDRWPLQLAALLQRKGLVVAPPEIIARTGWTTDELAAAIASTRPVGPYDLVTLQIGVNNQYRGRPLAEFRVQFQALLQDAIEWTRGREPARVIVLSIPDWGVTPFAAAQGRDQAAVSSAIDQFNASKRELTLAAGAQYVDITDLTREAARNPALLAADGLHPSALDYSRWAKRAALKLRGE